MEIEIHIKTEAGGHNSSIYRAPVIKSYNDQSDLGLCLGGKRREDGDKLTLIVIVPGPLRGNINVMDFITFIEFNRQVGVRKFIIYIFDQSEEMKKIIDYYAHRLQILDVLPWKCPFSNQKIRFSLPPLLMYITSQLSQILLPKFALE